MTYWLGDLVDKGGDLTQFFNEFFIESLVGDFSLGPKLSLLWLLDHHNWRWHGG